MTWHGACADPHRWFATRAPVGDPHPSARSNSARSTSGLLISGLLISAVLASGCSAPRPGVSVGSSRQPTTTSTSSAAVPASPSAAAAGDGVGDRLFPDLGNPGIDVTHYDIALAYDPDTTTIDATVVLSVVATADLDRLTLDAIGLDVDEVTINGATVSFAPSDPELVITPATTVARGTSISVAVSYSVVASESAATAGVGAGWFPTEQGSFTLDEPDGARTWLPSNDHPSDKATYRFAIRVPDGVTAIANGALRSSDSDGSGGRVWVWDQPEPMTTYVVQILTGRYSIVWATTPHGLALISALLAGDEDLMQPYLDVTPRQIDFFDDYFGPFPFDSYGIAMTDLDFGGAMEQQGRALFSRDDFASGDLGDTQELLLSHELAHMWFGDAVSPARWQDIWLNESFATYGEWMWLDHEGRGSVAAAADAALSQRHGGSVATAQPSAEALFGFEVYEGGAVVLHALRLTIGDEAFFHLLQRWVADNLDRSATTEDFVALAGTVSRLDLTSFFAHWLYASDIPDTFPS